MVVYFDIEDFLDRFFDGLDARVAEFDHFARIGHDDVVVLLVEIRLFVVRLVLPELVLADERAIQKQFDGIVQRRAAHAVVFVFHLDVEVFDIKMFLAVVNFLENRIPFRRLAMAFVFEVFRKDILYNFLIFTVIYGYECHVAKVILLVESQKLK